MSSLDRDLERVEAQLEEQKENEVNNIRALVPKTPAHNTECDCGVEIPKPRQQAGYENCVACQTKIEFQQKHFAKRF